MYPALDKLYSTYLELSKKIETAPTKDELKQYGKLSKFASLYQELTKIDTDIVQAEELSKTDNDLAELAMEELKELSQKKRELLLKISDYIDDGGGEKASGVIIEIRPGTGGEEASIFANDLLRMYLKFIEFKGWKYQIIDISYTEQKGIKNANFSVDSEEAYNYFKFEAGAHRVQRVPKTEASGRIHTSIATVAALKEVSDVSIEIKREDLDIETKRSGGPGGQHVNKTESAVRIKHKPTGITVECESDRSQQRNKDLAMKLLKAKVYDYFLSKQKSEEAEERRKQIGSGERGEKIRTYNFTQNRVTDHRINYSIYELERFMDGNLDEMFEKLLEHEREKKLAKIMQS